MEEKEWLPKVPLQLNGSHETGIIMTVLALRNKMICQGTLPKADMWGQGPRTEFPRKGLQKAQRGAGLGELMKGACFILPLYFPGSTLSKVKVMELTLTESWRLSDCRVTNRSPQVSTEKTREPHMTAIANSAEILSG